MINTLLFEPSWQCYDENFLTKSTYIKTNKIGFPILDKSSDIMLKITYVDMLKLSETQTLTSVFVPKSEQEQIIYSHIKPKSIAFCGPETIYTTEMTRDEYKSVLDQSTLPSNVHQVCLHYSLRRLLKLLHIAKDYRDAFYETVLYQIYSELNKNQFFLSKLFLGANKAVTKCTDRTLLATSVSLYFRKYNTYEIDSNWCLMSKEMKGTFFSNSKIYATPRVLCHCLPPQQHNSYVSVLTDGSMFLKFLQSSHARVPTLFLNLFASISDPSQIYSFHYISHLGAVLPLAIHPNLCMTFATRPQNDDLKTRSQSFIAIEP
jgi:hypothetical protein